MNNSTQIPICYCHYCKGYVKYYIEMGGSNNIKIYRCSTCKSRQIDFHYPDKNELRKIKLDELKK